MKKLHVLLGLVFIVAFVACTVSPTNRLVGNWQKENGSDTISFFADGKMSVVSGPATINTTYKLSGSDKIELDMGMFGKSAITYSLSKDSLTITDAHGNASRFNRVKEVVESTGKAG